MKYLVLIICLLLLGLTNNVCLSQQVYTFKYDDNGNRTSRTIVLPPLLKSAVGTDSAQYKEYTDKIDELEISLYPNPTKGEITIRVRNFENLSTISISVFDFAGHMLMTITPLQESNSIDLSQYPRATYIIRIKTGERETEWKVIKQ